MQIFMTLVLAVTIQTAGSLGRELLGRNLPVPKDAADLELPITSYSVLDDSRGFVIAYYLAESDNSLHELRVRSFDKLTRTWRSATFPDPIGSVLSIKRAGGYLYIGGHSSPSAAPLLVLSADRLSLRRELDGWPVLVLGDGRVVFERSMIHFLAAHAAALALYDPRIDAEQALYPDASAKNHRGAERVEGTDLWVERSMSKPVEGNGNGPQTIEFTVTTQRMRLDDQQLARPAAAEERFDVLCDLAARPATCRRKE